MSDCRDKNRTSALWWEDLHLALKVLMVLGGIVLAAGLLFLFGFVVMHLWNWLMPEIFGLKTVTYWQAWGLLVLSCILLKGWGRPGSGSTKGNRKIRDEVGKAIGDEIRGEIRAEFRRERENGSES